MSSDVDDPWTKSVNIPIEDRGDADFERRTTTLSLQDTSGDPRAIAEALADEWDVSKNVATDRVVRMYLTHLLDKNNMGHLRGDYDVTTLIPPAGWTDQVEPLDLEYSGNQPTLTTSVPPTVKDMIDDVLESDVDISSPADFLRQAVYWVVDES
jgi:hypothetical protein